ncbi:FAD-binding oxidoreductase [Desulfopila aestuarii]|uniref:Glycolate oxidase n=1 Tax=Desulfopila aestuarii DSM 18488 TaxID=1121416 RepID=A0A1M7Y7P7_9BACT|nr:FAD-linked oxidase C-terminal domain-containing protein [Desulfopila aestuarii]SHO48647.1 glycolate oxidase [Desulfopila aestuarii DSM 18488]
MKPELIHQLQAIVGSKHCTTRPEDLHCYSYDGRSTGPLPEVVVFPDSTEQVSRIMQLASAHRFPVVPRGAGTGMTGGSLPVKGGAVMVLTRMNRILEIDRQNQIAIAEPGVITADLQKEARKHGLFYPPDPASVKFCTLGGNAGECAGGLSAVKYGVTKDFIIGLEVVLPSGEIITTGTRTEKGVTGYDLTRLFVGCEGTLGIITRLTCRLLPLPEARETFLVSSESLAATTTLVATILNNDVLPCTLEYMDRTAIGIVTGFMAEPPPENTEALLLLELDGTRQSVAEESERLQQLLASHPEFTVHKAATRDEAATLWQARRSISPATFNLKPNKISEDVAVPRSRIPELVAFCEKMAAELNLIVLTFGHAGDGNIHVNIMLDKSDPEQERAGEEAKKRLFEFTISIGGTLSGEHGIGTAKSKFLPLELNPATIRAMKGIKQLFDPLNILNPGKIFPAE